MIREATITIELRKVLDTLQIPLSFNSEVDFSESLIRWTLSINNKEEKD